LGPEN